MDPVAEFLDLFHTVEQRLREIAGDVQAEMPYSIYIAKAAQRNWAAKEASVSLSSFNNLRNALSHNKPVPGAAIALPTPEGLDALRRIADNLRAAPLATTIQKPVKLFAMTDSLLAVLRYMRESDFSQVVVWSGSGDGGLRLLTVEGVARWCEHGMESNYIDTAGAALVSDALALDLPDSFVVLSRTRTVEDARAAFETALQEGRPRLYAALITHSGKKTEQPLGIITPWAILEYDRRRAARA